MAVAARFSGPGQPYEGLARQVNGKPAWTGEVRFIKAAEERIPHLLNTPAAIRFLSCEPLLGPVNLDVPRGPLEPGKTIYPPWFSQSAIHWVITGGESGRYFRPANLDWYRTLRDQCVRCRIAYFHKQDSGLRSGTGTLLDGVEWKQFPKAAA
jgi:protein gp37